MRRKTGGRTDEEKAALLDGSAAREEKEDGLPEWDITSSHPRPAVKIVGWRRASDLTQLVTKGPKYNTRQTEDADETNIAADNDRTGWKPPQLASVAPDIPAYESAGVPGPKIAATAGENEAEYARHLLTDEMFEHMAKESCTYAEQQIQKHQRRVDAQNVLIDQENLRRRGTRLKRKKRKHLDAVVSCCRCCAASGWSRPSQILLPAVLSTVLTIF